MEEKSDIVISGMSGRFPESNNMDEFWENLIQGVDLVTTDNRRWPMGYLGIPNRKGTLKTDLTKFDANFFGFASTQAERLDPQIRQLLEVTYEAIIDAGMSPSEIRGENIGVYVGASWHDTVDAYRRQPYRVSGYDVTGNTGSMIANRLSYAFDLHGPSLCVDTFCSSSMMALHQAMSAIRSGECNAAIVSGVNLLLNPTSSLQILRAGALSTDGKCKAFDVSANGYVRSEAVVSFFIQKANVARRSYGTLVYTKSNSDGYKLQGIAYPSGSMQQKLLEETYLEAGINPLDVFYVEPHGTGTQAGDKEEVNAITEVFTPGRPEGKPLLIGSTKSNLGHAEPAAGLCAVAKIALALKYGIIPQNLHFQIPNSNISALSDGRIRVVSQNTPVSGTLVAVNSTGIGGSNVHVIIRCNTMRRCSVDIPLTPVLIPFSGRTEEAVQYALSKVCSSPRNYEFESLLHKISESTIPGHLYRGFTILSNGETPLLSTQAIPTDLPPLWFVFTGMGTIWRGMTNELMEITLFAKSIQASHLILKTMEIDLLNILLYGDDELLNRHMGVCFIAMGVALTDLLSNIGLKPDGFIGHSAGEMMCAYIDGSVSHGEALISYFYRDKLLEKLSGGAMASVGLTWKEAETRCPPGVYRACHNAANNVTVSGPVDKINTFVKELKAEGIFAKEVLTGGKAFHSPYVSPILNELKAHWNKTLSNSTIQRSAKWKSCSLPESDWTKSMTSADYAINNIRSPVLFHSTVKHIPKDAVVVEVSSHALLISLLKKTLPSTCNILGLIRKGSGNNAMQLLTTIGKLYQFGYNVRMSALYPNVEFPVSPETPMISPLVKWDHSETHPLPDYLFTSSNTGERTVEVSLESKSDSYISGHRIDGRVIFPATGYLVLVWKKFAEFHGLVYDKQPVVFENVRFEQPTTLPKQGSIKLLVRVSQETGKFKIVTGDTIAARGTVKVAGNTPLEYHTLTEQFKRSAKSLLLTVDDAYKDFYLRGYEYDGIFKGIKMVDIEGKCAKVEWKQNWVAYLDSLLQVSNFSGNTRGLFLPTRIKRATIKPNEFYEFLDNNAESILKGVPVFIDEKLQKIRCSGVEIIGFKCTLAPRKAMDQTPVLEHVKFTPYFVEELWSDEEAIKFFTDVVVENTSQLSFNMREHVSHLNKSISSLIMTFVKSQPLRSVVITCLSEGGESMEEKLELEEHGITVCSKSTTDSVEFFVTEYKVDLVASDALVKENGFILFKTSNPFDFEVNIMSLVATRRTNDYMFYLFRKKIQKLIPPVVINVDDKNFKWLRLLQDSMSKSATNEKNSRILLTSFQNPYSGIIGLVNSLRREPGGSKIRCLFSTNVVENIDKILQTDLVMNVIGVDELWGSYRHFSLKAEELGVIDTPYAYINVQTRGDLSSLRFIETAPPNLNSFKDNKFGEICEVYYAPLNFRDIMLATGKLPPGALPGKLATQDCVLGLEFVGKNKSGKRMMGMVEMKGLATHVHSDPFFTWEIPKAWTMEEAATIPVAYSTAYYALLVRGRMRNGESVLIHSGSGGVGQAAIAIALSMDCNVFITVGSPEKKHFLMKQFPSLSDKSFGNSRDTTFEDQVMHHTNGRGMDLVLNSLSDEKLQASIRCLAEGGRFLEIGKYDMSKNSSLGMEVFLKNVTFHGILLDALFDKSFEEKQKVVSLLSEGIQMGTVRPLPFIVFQTDEIEDAFRFMANGKHIGKVVIKIKDENLMNQNISLFSAKVATYFHSTKCFIVVGGLGGVGFELVRWMIERGVRKILIVSRSCVKNGYQALAIRQWAKQGINISIVNMDVTTPVGASSLIHHASKFGPIGGIFNLAMVLKDGVIENQSVESFEAASNPKINGTMCLDAASRELCPELEYFVVFSSVAAGHGNAGQTNYAFANSSMERICEERRLHKFSGLAIQFGAIGDVGVVESRMGGNNVIVGGTVTQRLISCLSMLDIFLKNQTKFNIVSSIVLPQVLDTKCSNDKSSLLATVANILCLKNISSVKNKSLTLGEFGMDSLMAVEVKQVVEFYTDVHLSTNAIREMSWDSLEQLSVTK